MTVINVPVQLARKTEAEWYLQNPTLLAGQIAISSDAAIVNNYKVGPGEWVDLDYVLTATGQVYTGKGPTTNAIGALPANSDLEGKSVFEAFELAAWKWYAPTANLTVSGTEGTLIERGLTTPSAVGITDTYQKNGGGNPTSARLYKVGTPDVLLETKATPSSPVGFADVTAIETTTYRMEVDFPTGASETTAGTVSDTAVVTAVLPTLWGTLNANDIANLQYQHSGGQTVVDIADLKALLSGEQLKNTRVKANTSYTGNSVRWAYIYDTNYGTGTVTNALGQTLTINVAYTRTPLNVVLEDGSIETMYLLMSTADASYNNYIYNFN